MMVMQMAYASTFSIYDEVQSDIYICAFETADHLYSPLAFYLSKSAFQVNVQVWYNLNQLSCENYCFRLIFIDCSNNRSKYNIRFIGLLG